MNRFQYLALVLLGIAAGTPALAEDETAAKAAFAAVRAALAPHSDGFFLDAAPAAPALLKRQWSETSRWAAAYLDEHPAATEAELAAAVEKLSPDLAVATVRLDPKTFLVSVSSGEVGTVFIIGARGNRFAPLWSIADAARNARRFGVLAAWSAERARVRCRRLRSEKAWGTCGPVFAAIAKLSDQRDGSPRFYVNGIYAQPAGMTVGAQLSIWRWTGRTAEPLYADTYGYMIDQAVGTRLDGNFLRLRVKDGFKTFFACGACEERQREWTLRIDPEGIVDLGRASVVPELDLIDTVYERLFKKQSVRDLADPAVVKVLQPVVDDAREEAATSGGRFALGMLLGWKMAADGQRRMLCLSTDAGGTYLFTIDTVRGQPRLTAAEDRGDAGCGE